MQFLQRINPNNLNSELVVQEQCKFNAPRQVLLMFLLVLHLSESRGGPWNITPRGGQDSFAVFHHYETKCV